MSGYLLPWDQKAYWATTVTINVARSTPVAGEFLASVLRGGPELGALTLGRWYAAHVFLLPAALVLFVASHLVLMRRHGISGPLRPRFGPQATFFPWHVMKDTVMMAAVFASLVAMAALVPAPLDEVANPADASYVPRPEWYFLSLFQLLKYLPGPLEPVATQLIPGSGGRIPRAASVPRPASVTAAVGDGAPAVHHRARRRSAAASLALTALGLRRPAAGKRADDWGLLPIAGLELATGERSACRRCHVAGRPGRAARGHGAAT